jgi:hypothetical protein
MTVAIIIILFLISLHIFKHHKRIVSWLLFGNAEIVQPIFRSAEIIQPLEDCSVKSLIKVLEFNKTGILHLTLLRALEFGDVTSLKEAAVKALGTKKDPKAVEMLIFTLQNTETKIRLSAIEALGETGDQLATDPLITILQDSETNERIATIYALGKIGNQKAVDSLIATLKNSDADLSLLSAESLVNIGNDLVVESITSFLEDKNNLIQLDILRELYSIGNKCNAEKLISLLDFRENEMLSAINKDMEKLESKHFTHQVLVKKRLSFLRTEKFPYGCPNGCDLVPKLKPDEEYALDDSMWNDYKKGNVGFEYYCYSCKIKWSITRADWYDKDKFLWTRVFSDGSAINYWVENCFDCGGIRSSYQFSTDQVEHLTCRKCGREERDHYD